MTGRLPVVSGDDAIAAFRRAGYDVTHQRGSHVRMRHPLDPGRLPLPVPRHHELKPGLLRRLVRDVGLSIDEFRGLLR